MSNVKTAMMLASCTLACSVAAAMSVLEPPISKFKASDQDVPLGTDMGVNDPVEWFGRAEVDNANREGGPPPLDCTCAEEYFPGDQVQAAIDNPQGNPQIMAGDFGTVICGRFNAGGEFDLVLVEWDIDNGNDGFGACDCPSDGVAADSQGMYVLCGEIEPAPCVGDTNQDNVVNVTDLLALLASWGSCAGCPADLNDDDVVNVTDLLALLANWGAC